MRLSYPHDRIALAAIKSGQDKGHPLMVYGRMVGVMAFRRELIGKAYIICQK